MKASLIFALFFSCLAPAFAKTSCEILASSLKVKVDDPSPTTVMAGDTVSLQAKIQIEPSLKEWFSKVSLPSIPIQVIGKNNVTGSKSLTDFLAISAADVGEATVEKTHTFELKTTPAMMGTYLPSIMTLYFADGLCKKVFFDSPQKKIFVDNSPTQADINPPVISEVYFDKLQFQINETLSLRIRVLDKSPVCINAHGRCAATV